MTLRIMAIRHNTQHETRVIQNAILFSAILTVDMLSIVINVIMFSIVMLKSVMLTIITLSATMVYYCAECKYCNADGEKNMV